MRKIILIIATCFVVFIILIGIKIYNSNLHNNISESVSVETKTQMKKYMTFNNENANSIIFSVFGFDENWNSDDYPISDNFKHKYYTKNDINAKFINATNVSAVVDIIRNDKIILNVGSNNEPNINYYYECIVNDDGELDDLKYIRQVEYAEYPGESGIMELQRKDRKIEAKNSNITELLLRYIACSKPNDITGDEFQYFSEERMPYSDICEVIGRPNKEEIGNPEFVYFGDEHPMTGERKYEDDKSPDGYPYLTFDYGDYIKKYEVIYKINDENFFDYIEYKRVYE